VLTLTGGSNLPTWPGIGVGALFLPCLEVGGYSQQNSGSMGSFGITHFNYGYSCDSMASGAWGNFILLDVPTTAQLTLHAEADGGCCPGFARFTGIHFITWEGGLHPIDDATFTLSLNEALPAHLPEPGSFALLATALALWAATRSRCRL